ncbi:hypothetical protein [Chryseobacterium sp.]|uniref:hypothetical protein n=1 Tax=Chryseobacterium sp. TaxID=1871047 RepID=UPI0011CBAE7E|nr:hypothetical protein [Chryseobacterium sp.]TXF79282.1 hypothetical protein FUA25_02505 [Chryseobacterium sp.]
MSVDFESIFQHVIPMEGFGRKWRFTEENYDMLPGQDLEQLKPLDQEAAEFLNDYISTAGLHHDVPFTKGFFKTTDHIRISDGNEKEIKKWLYQRGLPFDKPVFLSWDQTDAMIVPWNLVVKYFDSFYYGVSDDLTIMDQSLNWAVLFFHENQIYFGSNTDF